MPTHLHLPQWEVLERIGTGIVLVDRERGVLDANRAAERILGFSARELAEHRSAEEPWALVERDGAANPHPVAAVFATGEAVDAVVARVVHGRSCDDRWVRVSAQPVSCERPCRHVVATLEDVTDLEKARASLAERAARLARANAELDAFAAACSHDLKAPLREVDAFARLLARRYSGSLGPDAEVFLAILVDAPTRMRRLIDDLLDYARVGSSRRVPGPADASAAFDSAMARLRHEIAEARARIERGPLPAVLADETQLSRVFQNLVDNAIKYRSEAPPRLEVTAEDGDGEVRFTVRDNGIGMDPALASRAFEPFRRLRARQEPGGSGLGLAMCRRIVQKNGGKIWIESEEGQGTTIRFTLPAARSGAS